MLHNKTRPPAHTKPRFKSHVRAHEEIISNEFWCSDQPPRLGSRLFRRQGSRAHHHGDADPATGGQEARKERRYQAGPSLLPAARQDRRLPATQPVRSLACPRCARAFQKAKIAAQQAAIITQAAKTRPGRHLVFVTVVPKAMMYSPGKIHEVDVKKANRWLKDALKPVGKRLMLGSADLGWESRRSGKYFQVHWHLAMWTSNRKKLKAKLAKVFPRAKKNEKPVQVKMAYDHGFLGYMNKAIKLPPSPCLRCPTGTHRPASESSPQTSIVGRIGFRDAVVRAPEGRTSRSIGKRASLSRE